MRRNGVIGFMSGSARKLQKNGVLHRAVIEALDPRRLLTTITVTGIGDTIANDGIVTLREAITAANTNAPSGDAPAGESELEAVDEIDFDILPNGAATITPTSALPTITEAVSIFGSNETGFGPVELNGSSAGPGVDGLKIQAAGVTIDHLAINRFTGNGISAHSSKNIHLTLNFIGTSATGTTALPNGGDGILFDAVSDSNIGSDDFFSNNGNIISGNMGHGIEMINGSDNNRIEDNNIGVANDEQVALGNGKDGIHIADSGDNRIGADALNHIGANGGNGIFITGAGSTHNQILDNSIGATSSGTNLGNALDGIRIEASHTTIGSFNFGSVIGGNGGAGVHIVSGKFNDISDNNIGGDGFGNTGAGILIESPNNTVGEPFGGPGNSIAGNGGPGIQLTAGAHDCSIASNSIGLGSFDAAVPNQGGILLDGAAHNTILGNTIAGNHGDGILIQGAGATDNRILTNRIGVTSNFFGAALGNEGAGINIKSSGNIVGRAVGDSEGNRIAGNVGPGVLISGNSNIVFGNTIGFNDTFNEEIIGNLFGIRLVGSASQNVIGGVAPSAGNEIAFNGVGVSIEGTGNGNAILSNSIHDNILLGIDLNHDGPTLNDPSDTDSGPNDLLNAPVLASAVSDNFGTTFSASIDSIPNSTFLVQFFSDVKADASGFGEGDVFLGQATVVTNASGKLTFDVGLSQVLVSGQIVSATATLMNGSTPLSTSEFSNAVSVTGNPPLINVNNIEVEEGNGGTTEATFTFTLPNAINQTVKFDYSTANGTATAPGDYIAQSSSVTFLPGETLRTVTIFINGDSTIEDSETFALNLSNAVNGQFAANQISCTIINDDFPPPPVVSINDVSLTEGNIGQKQFVFTLTRTGDLTFSSEVECETLSGTATEFDDFESNDRFISFDPGQKTATFTVLVNGDTTVEPDETFTVRLFESNNVSIVDNEGTGTIKNDDGVPASPGKVSIITDPTDGSKKALKIEGTSNADQIVVTRSGTAQGKVIVKINGATKGTFTFSGAIEILGNAGDDNISTDSAITRSVFAFGGDGKDTFAGGGGNDVIFGEASDDSIKGGAGRDILIGGTGTDKLDGGAGDDILIGGDFKTKPTFSQLASLLKEWTRTDANYATRVSHLKSGGGFNSIKLTSATLFSAANVHDSLTGGANNDLFCASVPGGVLADKTTVESLVDIG